MHAKKLFSLKLLLPLFLTIYTFFQTPLFCAQPHNVPRDIFQLGTACNQIVELLEANNSSNSRNSTEYCTFFEDKLTPMLDYELAPIIVTCSFFAQYFLNRLDALNLDITFAASEAEKEAFIVAGGRSLSYYLKYPYLIPTVQSQPMLSNFFHTFHKIASVAIECLSAWNPAEELRSPNIRRLGSLKTILFDGYVAPAAGGDHPLTTYVTHQLTINQDLSEHYDDLSDITHFIENTATHVGGNNQMPDFNAAHFERGLTIINIALQLPLNDGTLLEHINFLQQQSDTDLSIIATTARRLAEMIEERQHTIITQQQQINPRKRKHHDADDDNDKNNVNAPSSLLATIKNSDVISLFK